MNLAPRSLKNFGFREQILVKKGEKRFLQKRKQEQLERGEGGLFMLALEAYR